MDARGYGRRADVSPARAPYDCRGAPSCGTARRDRRDVRPARRRVAVVARPAAPARRASWSPSSGSVSAAGGPSGTRYRPDPWRAPRVAHLRVRRRRGRRTRRRLDAGPVGTAGFLGHSDLARRCRSSRPWPSSSGSPPRGSPPTRPTCSAFGGRMSRPAPSTSVGNARGWRRDPVRGRDHHLRRRAGPRSCRDVDLHVPEGELCLVVGPTGSGKSTLLRAVNGLVPHFSGGRLAGRVTVAGRDTRTHPPRELADVVGIVGQDPLAGFVADIVEEELAYGMESLGLPSGRHAAAGRGDARPARARRAAQPAAAHAVRRPAAARRARRRPHDAPEGPPARRAHLGPRPACRRGGPRRAATARPRPRPHRARSPSTGSSASSSTPTASYASPATAVRSCTAIPRASSPIPRSSHRSSSSDVSPAGPAPPVRTRRAPPGRPAPRPGWPPTAPDLDRRAANTRSRRRPKIRRGWSCATARVVALRSVDLDLHAGEVVAVMGRNGAGKSTLLQALVGAQAPDAGEVRVGDVGPATLAGPELLRRVGLVPQDAGDLLWAETVGRGVPRCRRGREGPGRYVARTAHPALPGYRRRRPPARPLRGPAARPRARGRARRGSPGPPARRADPRPRLPHEGPPRRTPPRHGRRRAHASSSPRTTSSSWPSSRPASSSSLTARSSRTAPPRTSSPPRRPTHHRSPRSSHRCPG